MNKFLTWAFHYDTPFWVTLFGMCFTCSLVVLWLVLTLQFQSWVVFFTPIVLWGFLVYKEYKKHTNQQGD